MQVKSLSYLRMHGRTTADVENQETVAQDPLGFCLDTWLHREESEASAPVPEHL